MRRLFSEVNGWIMTLILVFKDGSNNEQQATFQSKDI